MINSILDASTLKGLFLYELNSETSKPHTDNAVETITASYSVELYVFHRVGFLAAITD